MVRVHFVNGGTVVTWVGMGLATASFIARMDQPRIEKEAERKNRLFVLSGVESLSGGFFVLGMMRSDYRWLKLLFGIGMLVRSLYTYFDAYPSASDADRGEDPVGFRYDPEARGSSVEAPAGAR